MPGELEESRTQEVPTNEAVQPSLFSIAEDETAGAEVPTDSLVPAPNHSEEVGRQPGHAPEELRGGTTGQENVALVHMWKRKPSYCRTLPALW